MSIDTRLRSAGQALHGSVEHCEPADVETLASHSRRRTVVGTVAVIIAVTLVIAGTASIVATGRDAAPVASSSASTGPMEFAWVQFPLDGQITYPARWRDNYVALLGEQVATSPDGVSGWTAWPNQPPTLGSAASGGVRGLHSNRIALAVVGGEVIVIVAGEDTPITAQRSPDGASWHDLPIDEATPSASDASVSVFMSDSGLIVVRDSLASGWARDAWLLSGDAFVRAPDLLAISLLPVPTFSADVRIAPTNVAPPDGVTVVAERGGRYTGFVEEHDLETADAIAYTSVDGVSWESIEPVVADVDAECNGLDWRRTIVPAIVETGPLGWFAAGSDRCVSTVVWHSNDGLEWHRITDLDHLAAWVHQAAFPLPFPPVFLIEEDRVIVYAAEQPPRRSLWSAWVGVPTERQAVPLDGAWGRYGISRWSGTVAAVIADEHEFVEAFDSTYEELASCTAASDSATAAREDFRSRIDLIAATEGISPQDAYDRSVGAFLASLEWMHQHDCEEVVLFVSVG